jgi:hypothetical protein
VQALDALLASRHLGALEALVFVAQRLGDAGLARLGALAGTRLPKVRRLIVEDDAIGPRGVAALVDTRWFASLEHLSLAGNPLGPSGVATLTRSPRPTRLRRLVLDRVRCGDEGARALLGATCFPALEALSLGRNRLSHGAEQTLRDAGFPQA